MAAKSDSNQITAVCCKQEKMAHTSYTWTFLGIDDYDRQGLAPLGATFKTIVKHLQYIFPIEVNVFLKNGQFPATFSIFQKSGKLIKVI